MYEYDEKKAQRIKDDIEYTLNRFIRDDFVDRLLVTDLITDDEGDVFIHIELTYRGNDIHMGEYYIWMSCTSSGWTDPLWTMAEIMTTALKGMNRINDWWWRKDHGLQ